MESMELKRNLNRGNSVGKASPVPAHGVRLSRNRSGYAIPAVLIIALIGILFGIGRLATFRYQCMLRIDRQREIDRTLATRSALGWFRSLNDPPGDTNFVYSRWSGQDIDIEVMRVPTIYPSASSNQHFVITNGATGYAFASGVTFGQTAPDMEPCFIAGQDVTELKIGSGGSNTIGEVGYVSIDLGGTGSWLDDPYGRKFWFMPGSFANRGDTAHPTGDIHRLWIVPEGEDYSDTNTPAIWVEHKMIHGIDETEMALFSREDGHIQNLVSADVNYAAGKGIQLSGSRIAMVRWDNAIGSTAYGSFTYPGYGDLSTNVISSFRETTGEPKNLNLTLEVESRSSIAETNSFQWIRVDPAYEYTIRLSWDSGPDSYSELSTAVRFIPDLYGLDPALDGETGVYTYDSHGTEQK
jgi:hypothetical protein